MADVISVQHGELISNFESVSDGFNAAVSNDVVTLLEDATTQMISISNKKIVFDLNGHKLSTSSGSCVFYLEVGGELIVKDSSEEQTGAIVNTSQSGVYLSNTTDITKRPVFTLQSGTIEAQEFGVCTFGGGVININGGTVIAKDNGAVGSNGSNSSSKPYGQYPYEINITGGNIFANTESEGYANCAIYHANAGKLNISGGNIVSTAGAGVVVRAGDVKITGGSISGQGSSSGLKMGDANPTYCAGVEICNAANYPGKMGSCVISGGEITSIHNYGINVIGDPSEYPNAEYSKCVVSGGTISGELGAVGFVTKQGEEIEDDSAAKLTIVGGSFNSDVEGFIDPSVNLSIEYDADGNPHYVIKDGMKAVIAYLDELLDNSDAHDAETIENLKEILQSISEVSEKADTSNASLASIESDLSEAKTQIADILEGVTSEVSQLGDIKDSVDAVTSSSEGVSESVDSMNEKVTTLIALNEQIKALQQAAVTELARIAGDDVPDVDPVDTTDAEIMSIKALVENAKRTGQTSAIWQHFMTDAVRKWLDDNGYPCAAIPTAKIGNQWLITIPTA